MLTTGVTPMGVETPLGHDSETTLVNSTLSPITLKPTPGNQSNSPTNDPMEYL